MFPLIRIILLHNIKMFRTIEWLFNMKDSNFEVARSVEWQEPPEFKHSTPVYTPTTITKDNSHQCSWDELRIV